jgi:hypothetical protein
VPFTRGSVRRVRGRFRVTKLGWFFALAVVATALLAVTAPDAGLVAAIVLAFVVLGVLCEGILGEGSAGTVHDAWAGVEAERKREALRRRGR